VTVYAIFWRVAKDESHALNGCNWFYSHAATNDSRCLHELTIYLETEFQPQSDIGYSIVIEPSDTDGNGVPDYLDLDSDSDGIPDAVEAGVDGNAPLDTDGDGVMDFLEQDSDNDGIPDSVEAGSSPTNPVDTDGDGVADYLELDSDNDGLLDTYEAGDEPANPLDTDFDGVADYIDLDSENDGAANHLNLDSDNDGQLDLSEAGGDDLNGDGLVDAWTDSDGDGIVDAVDVTGGEDLDGDGIDDFADADFVALSDSDGDGILDLFDDVFLVTGFLPFAVDGEVVAITDPPDIDGDNIPDVWELNAPAAANPGGSVHTGLAGNGCSVAGINGAKKDPLLPLLGLFAAGFMLVRRRRVTAH